MNTIEAETIQPEENAAPVTALATRNAPEVAIAPIEAKPKTAQELRVSEVGDALAPAYQKASTLELTDEEIEALTKRFPDECVEIRPHDGLIYIPHIFIRQRLNQVFRPGKWATICRRHWLEGNTMYGEYVLLVRGCFVGEAIGGHPYQPNNPKTNYSDTLEATASEAIRRIAGKQLGCGSQVWEPEYARSWVAKHASQHNGKWVRHFSGDTRPTPPAPKRAPEPASPPAPKPAPTDDQRKRMIADFEPSRQLATEYFQKLGWLMPNEALEDLPLRFVPAMQSEMRNLGVKIADFGSGGQATEPYPAHDEAPTAKAKPAKKDAPDGLALTGTIDQVAVKSGTSAKGKAWTRYGIRIGTDWVNTFSATIGEAAGQHEKEQVTLYYSETERGKDAVELVLNDGTSYKAE